MESRFSKPGKLLPVPEPQFPIQRRNKELHSGLRSDIIQVDLGSPTGLTLDLNFFQPCPAGIHVNQSEWVKEGKQLIALSIAWSVGIGRKNRWHRSNGLRIRQ